MNVTGLAIYPPQAANNNPKVTPELLAACLAKYSRSNQGIESILKGVDWSDPDKSVEGIFRFVDYGHTSIGGLTGGIAMAIDGVSMLLAYKCFDFAQQADGQESSTRYIKMIPDNIPDPAAIGIPDKLCAEWMTLMVDALRIYRDLYEQLDRQAQTNPEIVRAPPGANSKIVDRLRRNYALDRVRYVLPFALKTNVALVMSARAWTEVIKQLDALGLPEAIEAASKLRNELDKFAPRLTKHSFADKSSRIQAADFFHYVSEQIIKGDVPVDNIPDEVYLAIEATQPSFLPQMQSLTDAFKGKENRYSIPGPSLRRLMARFAWNNMAIAELRDLNRHRTGYRYSPLVPVGFYLPDEVSHPDLPAFLSRYASLLRDLASNHQTSCGCFIYGFLLGTQVGYEHSTHADKLIYEIELRTGLGAHFRYAQHLRAIADRLIKEIPSLASYIQIGTAEPE